jgi:hypothetical protein
MTRAGITAHLGDAALMMMGGAEAVAAAGLPRLRLSRAHACCRWVGCPG